jgi:hypothetical protein
MTKNPSRKGNPSHFDFIKDEVLPALCTVKEKHALAADAHDIAKNLIGRQCKPNLKHRFPSCGNEKLDDERNHWLVDFRKEFRNAAAALDNPNNAPPVAQQERVMISRARVYLEHVIWLLTEGKVEFDVSKPPPRGSVSPPTRVRPTRKPSR